MTQTILLIIAFVVVLMTTISFYWNDKTTKFIVIALFVVLANAVYFSLDGVKGWPANEKQEVKGILASVVIINPSDETEGAIIISLFPKQVVKWYEYVYPRYAPKTYYLEYSNDRAAEFEKAKQAMIEGKEVRINSIPPKNAKGGDMEGDISESITEAINNIMGKIIPKQGDTYKPKVPDVEILEQQAPPEKGSQ